MMPKWLLQHKHTIEDDETVTFYKIQVEQYRFNVAIDKELDDIFHFMSIYENSECIFTGSSQYEADIWRAIEEFLEEHHVPFS